MQLFHVLPILQEGEGFYDNSTAVALFARQVECPNPIFFLWMTQNLCPDSRRSLGSSHEKHSLTQVARALPSAVVRTVQTIAKYDHFHCLIKESICKGQINLGQHLAGMSQGLKTWRGASLLPTSLQLVINARLITYFGNFVFSFLSIRLHGIFCTMFYICKARWARRIEK